jgi:hypothetical protein
MTTSPSSEYSSPTLGRYGRGGGYGFDRQPQMLELGPAELDGTGGRDGEKF